MNDGQENAGPESAEFLGKTVLVGITRINRAGEAVAQLQYHGRITSFTDDGIQIETAQGKKMTLPPAVESLQVAAPGAYREHASGAVVSNPDLISMWEIREAPEPGGEPSWTFTRIQFPPGSPAPGADKVSDA